MVHVRIMASSGKRTALTSFRKRIQPGMPPESVLAAAASLTATCFCFVTMKTFLAFTILCATTFAAQGEPVSLPASEALSTCLAESTTGKERKDLAKWIFVSMSAHPEIRSLATVSAADQLTVNKDMAALVTRLLTQSCAQQTSEVVAKEGSPGMFAAFRSLGELAMHELTSNPKVYASINSYAQYLDEKTIQAISGTGK